MKPIHTYMMITLESKINKTIIIMYLYSILKLKT